MRLYRHLLIAAATIATASIVIPERASASIMVAEGEVYAVSYIPASLSIFADPLLSSSYSFPTGYIGTIPSHGEQECEYKDRRDGSDDRISTSRDSRDTDCESYKKGRNGADNHDDYGHDGGSHNGNDKAPVPEPSTVLLVGSALAGYALLRRVRR